LQAYVVITKNVRNLGLVHFWRCSL